MTTATHTFCQLALDFDPVGLSKIVSQLQQDDWMPLSGDDKSMGTAAIVLVSVGGTPNHDYAISGPLQATPMLGRYASLQKVLQTLKLPVARCRVIRLPGQTAAPLQADFSYHSFRYQPICIPLQAPPGVKFSESDHAVAINAGEVWTFDASQPHGITNTSDEDCIYCLIETKKSGLLQANLIHGQASAVDKVDITDAPLATPLVLEPYRFEVLTPEEMHDLTASLSAELANLSDSQTELQELMQQIAVFQSEWKKTFAHFGHEHSGELAYQDLIVSFHEDIASKANTWLRQADTNAPRARQVLEIIRSMLFTSRPSPVRLSKRVRARYRRKAETQGALQSDFRSPTFARPIFLVSAPRAGSTLLFDAVSQFSPVWTIGDESHDIIEGIPALHPAAHEFASNCLTQADAQPSIGSVLHQRFTQRLHDRSGQSYLGLPVEQRPATVRFLEKTPKNALRIPFLKAIFPDARFIYLYRDPGQNVSSIMEGWRSRRFIAYQPLPGWPYRAWSFLLPPGWSSLQEASLAAIAAYQWQAANTAIMENLEALALSDWCLVRYTDLVQKPEQTLRKIGQFADFGWDQHIAHTVSQPLPLSPMTVSAPAQDKWRRHAWQLERLQSGLAHVVSSVEQLDACQARSERCR
jgi:hypothetical protein